MARRGKKPKSPRLRLVDGTWNVTRHGSKEDAQKLIDSPAHQFGKITQPKHLKGEALAAWKNWIEPASWLDGSRAAAAVAFCELWREFRFSPARFPASKHGQMRAYMSDLGLLDERNRPNKDDGEKDEFFEE